MSGVTKEDINDRAARIAQDILILERLQKRNSGVTVTTGDADIQKQNQRSLFETLCLRENKKKTSYNFFNFPKTRIFCQQHSKLSRRSVERNKRYPGRKKSFRSGTTI